MTHAAQTQVVDNKFRSPSIYTAAVGNVVRARSEDSLSCARRHAVGCLSFVRHATARSPCVSPCSPRDLQPPSANRSPPFSPLTLRLCACRSASQTRRWKWPGFPAPTASRCCPRRCCGCWRLARGGVWGVAYARALAPAGSVFAAWCSVAGDMAFCADAYGRCHSYATGPATRCWRRRRYTASSRPAASRPPTSSSLPLPTTWRSTGAVACACAWMHMCYSLLKHAKRIDAKMRHMYTSDTCIHMYTSDTCIHVYTSDTCIHMYTSDTCIHMYTSDTCIHMYTSDTCIHMYTSDTCIHMYTSDTCIIMRHV